MTDEQINGAPPAPTFTTIDDQKSWRRMAVATIILALATMFVTGTVLAYKSVRDAQRADRDSRERSAMRAEIESLRDELADTNVELDVDQARTSCRTTLGIEVSSRQTDLMVSLGDLIVVVATAPRDDEAAAAQRVRAAINNLDAKTDRLLAAATARDKYVADGSPLPCPIADD